MKWRFVYPWCRRVTPSSSILILRLLSTGVSVRFPSPSPFQRPLVLSRCFIAPSRPSPPRPLLARRTLSIPARLPFKSSPSYVLPSHPPARFSPPPSDLTRRLVSLAKKFTFAKKKREKGAKNRCATPIGRSRPGSRPALVLIALRGVA